jgi:GDPmannose 4,6-dehydratase
VRALITGVTGQDGSYLAEQLAAGGHQVHGLVRGQPSAKWAWVRALVPSLRLVHGDLLDQSSLQAALAQVRPDVVFNLGALTFVGMSWRQPAVMSEVTGLGALRLLEAVRATCPAARVVHASTSEMFGQALPPQHENTPLAPRSPYGVAKAFAHHTAVNCRESYGLHVSTAIMFNHESPRRGEEFVTRKVSLAVAAIAAGRQETLTLGRLDPRRDWGWAPDYMTALPLIAARDEPGDFVLATGETHSVAQLCEAAFAVAGLDWRDYVRTDPALHRPAEVEILRGDASRARDVLGWVPSLRFAGITERLVEHDMAALVAA